MIKQRESVNIEDTWALEDIFATDDLWRSAVEWVGGKLPEYERFKGKLSDSAEMLYRCLELDDEVGQVLEKIGCYARQKSDQDTTVTEYQDLAGRAEDLYIQAAQASSFIRAEITHMGEETVNRMTEAYGPLQKYRRLFTVMFREKEHTLSDQEEALLAAA